MRTRWWCRSNAWGLLDTRREQAEESRKLWTGSFGRQLGRYRCNGHCKGALTHLVAAWLCLQTAGWSWCGGSPGLLHCQGQCLDHGNQGHSDTTTSMVQTQGFAAHACCQAQAFVSKALELLDSCRQGSCPGVGVGTAKHLCVTQRKGGCGKQTTKRDRHVVVGLKFLTDRQIPNRKRGLCIRLSSNVLPEDNLLACSRFLDGQGSCHVVWALVSLSSITSRSMAQTMTCCTWTPSRQNPETSAASDPASEQHRYRTTP